LNGIPGALKNKMEEFLIMKKKVLAYLLCSTMLLATVLTGCSKEGTTNSAEDAKGATAASEIPQDYKYYYSFDAADDSEAIVATSQTIGGDPILGPADKENVYIPGVKGDAIYTDGITGYRLTDVNGVGDNYTVSFWIYATRLANYMPTVQFGPDVHGDATGNQHYVNITRAEWSGEGTFPCVWSYDQGADGSPWPAWSDAGTGEPLKEWMNIALVVDSSKLSADGSLIEGKLYINGEEYISKDSDGNVVPVMITKDCMAQSDNFDFLIGVNFWDSVFKGAFDELYIYDYALDAGQIAGLYADGDPTVAYEEPERVIEVKADEKAIASIGAMDYSKADDVYAETTAISDGQTIEVKLMHWSDGQDASHNYYFSLVDADGKEVARVNADMSGTVDEKAIDDKCFSWSWGNWNTWEQSVMVETSVTAKITKNGDEITIDVDNVDYNKTSNTATATFTAKNVAGIKIGTVNSYTDILSIKDKTVKAGGITVGNTDCTTGWWTQFSDVFAIPEGQTVTKNFTNYTDGVNNWDNFVVILQNTPSGHSADTTDGYAEYAVVRADNFGWGSGYDGIATAECDWNWDTFASDMDGAKCEVSITNNGDTADIVAVVTTVDGKTYNQSYKGIKTGGDLYACFSCEAAYLNFDVETVGNTDCTTSWWSQFSDIYAVAEGESKTVYFKNYTDGVNNWDNFVAILQNTPAGHSADADASYAEYAVVRADNFGWGTGYDGIATAECDWNWDTFTSDMDGAYVALTVTNNGATADIKAVVTTQDGNVYNQSYTGIKTGGDLYFCLSCEAAYLQIECEKVGNTDCTTSWWSQFSCIKPVESGKTVSRSFTNYTDGVNNWDNFVVILQNTPNGHSAEAAEGYAEYAVVRADNFGWGAGYDGIATAECDWNWDTFTSDMDGANVNLAVTNNGKTADITATVTTKEGKVYHQTYKDIAVDGDLYFCLSCEASYLAITD